MKKILFVLILILSLSGCTITEDTDAYRNLSNQFDQIVIKEIHQKEGFNVFFNEITKVYVKSNIKVQISVFNGSKTLIRNDYGTAFIYHEDDTHYYALSVLSIINIEEGQTYHVTFYDFFGNVYEPEEIKRDESSQLVAYKFLKSTKVLEALEFQSTQPMIHEPIFLIGNPNHTQNAILFGLYQSITDDIISTTIPSDLFASGSAILNISYQCIGIQIGIDNNTSVVLSSEIIILFLEQNA